MMHSASRPRKRWQTIGEGQKETFAFVHVSPVGLDKLSGTVLDVFICNDYNPYTQRLHREEVFLMRDRVVFCNCRKKAYITQLSALTDVRAEREF